MTDPVSKNSKPNTSAGEELGAHPHQGLVVLGDVPLDEGQMLGGIHVGVVDHGAELAAVARRQVGIGDSVDQRIVLEAVLDEVGDGADLEVVLLAELLEVRQPRHGAVVPS